MFFPVDMGELLSEANNCHVPPVNCFVYAYLSFQGFMVCLIFSVLSLLFSLSVSHFSFE